MADKSLDPEIHEDDTVVSVWKRRALLVFLILLVVAVAAPSFSGCTGAFATRTTIATFEVAGKKYEVTDEDLRNLESRYVHTGQLIQQRFDFSGEEGTQHALELIMRQAAAKAAGVHVPESRVADLIRVLPFFQTAGRFDERVYRHVLADATRGALTADGFFETLRELMRDEAYRSIYDVAFAVVPGDDAYDSWKKANVKVSADYVVFPYDTLREKVASMNVTDEDLKTVQDLPDVKRLLAVPPRKTVEVAYVKVEDFTPESFEAAKKFAQEAELFTEEQSLTAKAFMKFFADRDVVFTRERFTELADPDYAKKKRDFDEDHKKWEAEPKENRRAEPQAPKDPAADYPPEDAPPRALFDKMWQERVEKEVLAQELVRHLAKRAERDNKSFTDLAPDYAKYGVKVVRNAEPLSDTEIVEKFPDPVARDSEFDQVARVRFRAPAEGQTFKPQIHGEPVPTTRVAQKIHDRGYMVMRLELSDPARQYSVAEKRDVVVDFFRKHKLSELARESALKVKKQAEEAGKEPEKVAEGLRKAAEEAGTKVRTLRRFNRMTTAPRAPTAEPGKELTADLKGVARNITYRNRVQQEYPMLSATDVGKFREPLLDEKAEAAFVILVVEKHEPTPLEMQDQDLANQRYGLAQQAMSKAVGLMSYDALAKRFHLERFDNPEKREPASMRKGAIPPKPPEKG